jgi:hypothetical protein
MTFDCACTSHTDPEQQQPKSSRGRRKRRTTPNTSNAQGDATAADTTALARPETAASGVRDAAVSRGGSLHGSSTATGEDYVDHFESKAEPATTANRGNATAVSEEYVDHFELEPEHAAAASVAAAAAGTEPSVVTTATAGTAGYAADEFEVSDD